MPIKFSAILIVVSLVTVFVLLEQPTFAPAAAAPAATLESTAEATPEATAEATAEVTTASPETALVGDPVRGKDIFEDGLYGSPACKNCHSTGAGHGLFAIAPNMTGIAKRAALRVPGMSAPQYIEESIRHPESYIVSGFRPIMYPDFAEDYTDQDIADVVAYLMTL
ncbi:MAG: cytochrome c [Chloroflexota bacterium]